MGLHVEGTEKHSIKLRIRAHVAQGRDKKKKREKKKKRLLYRVLFLVTVRTEVHATHINATGTPLEKHSLH